MQVTATKTFPTLKDGQIHLWHWAVSNIDSRPELMNLLAVDEQSRIARLQQPSARLARMCSRIGMRYLLGRYLNTAPAAVPIRYGRLGRPHLDYAVPTLNFNVSHSGDWVAMAIAVSERLGVDIERIRAQFPSQRLIERICSPREQAVLQSLSPAERRAAFFRGWTRKEAIMKATGGSIFHAPNRIDVSFGESPTPTLYAANRGERHGWLLRHFVVDPQTVGAIAIEPGDWTVARRRLRLVD